MNISSFGVKAETFTVKPKGELVVLKDREKDSEVYVSFSGGEILCVEYCYNPTDTLVGELTFWNDSGIKQPKKCVIQVLKSDFDQLILNTKLIELPFYSCPWEIIILHADEKRIIFVEV